MYNIYIGKNCVYSCAEFFFNLHLVLEGVLKSGMGGLDLIN